MIANFAGARYPSAFVRFLAAKRGIAGVGGVLNLRCHGFYRKHADIVTSRENLALDFDLLTLVTSQGLGICDQPELAVFCDQAFSILAH